MKSRRHHNNQGYRRIKRGKLKRDAAKFEKKYLDKKTIPGGSVRGEGEKA
jgi:hypothetical protein